MSRAASTSRVPGSHPLDPPPGPAPGSARDFAVLFAPPGQRSTLSALFALQAAIQSSGRGSADHSVAHARLEWWRAEMERLSAGTPVHPLCRTLRKAAEGRHVDLGLLGELATAAQWELARLTLETNSEFEANCWRSQGALQWVAIQMATDDCGEASATPAEAASFARALGFALGVERAIATLAETSRVGCIPFPLLELNARGIALEDLGEANPSQELRDYIASLSAQARAGLLASIQPLVQPAKRALRAQVVLAGLCGAQLAKFERTARDAGPLARPISPLHRLWTAWRAARLAA